MSDVNAELLAAAKQLRRLVAPFATERTKEACSRMDAAIARAEAAQGALPNGGEESVGVTRTCVCEPACGFVCAQCSEVRT